jgi:hypothetical protein
MVVPDQEILAIHETVAVEIAVDPGRTTGEFVGVPRQEISAIYSSIQTRVPQQGGLNNDRVLPVGHGKP